MFKKKFILGVGFTASPEKLVLEYIIKNIKKSQKRYYIVTPNPELLVIAHNNSEYKKVLNGAKLALPDGIGIILVSKLLGKGINERITGVDLVDDLCKRVAKKPITVGFFGGGPGIAEKTAECLRKKYPGLKVGFAQEEWSEINSSLRQPHLQGNARLDFFQKQQKNRSLSERLYSGSDKKSAKDVTAFSSPANGLPRSNRTIDILFVAFGSPKQEIWISENLRKLPIKVAIGVGGAFDFISGKVRRAPVWMRNLGLEWLFRLIIQPWRIKRQLSLLKFIILVFKEDFFRLYPVY